MTSSTAPAINGNVRDSFTAGFSSIPASPQVFFAQRATVSDIIINSDTTTNTMVDHCSFVPYSRIIGKTNDSTNDNVRRAFVFVAHSLLQTNQINHIVKTTGKASKNNMMNTIDILLSLFRFLTSLNVNFLLGAYFLPPPFFRPQPPKSSTIIANSMVANPNVMSNPKFVVYLLSRIIVHLSCVVKRLLGVSCPW